MPIVANARTTTIKALETSVRIELSQLAAPVFGLELFTEEQGQEAMPAPRSPNRRRFPRALDSVRP